MDKYVPLEIEDKWYKIWSDKGYFKADNTSSKPPFSIVIPPPNVTGSLHMGHALNNTLQDTIARYKRAKGLNVLWLPGCDHAGIATQNVVERQLAAEGKDRFELGREAFGFLPALEFFPSRARVGGEVERQTPRESWLSILFGPPGD